MNSSSSISSSSSNKSRVKPPGRDRDILLAKRTDKLVADFQDYVSRIEAGTPVRRTPEDSPECQIPSPIRQNKKYAGHGSLEAYTGHVNLAAINQKEQFNMLRDFDEESNDSQTIKSHENARATLCSNNRKNLALNVMVKCALFGSLVALIVGVTARKKDPSATMYKQDLPGSAALEVKEDQVDIHKLNWFDRSKWIGQTYTEAVEFCASKDQSLCAYETICPFGPGSYPVGGEFTDGPTNGLTWAAINNAPNSWAQVGSKDHCLKYDFIHNGPPAWGITGENSEEITRHSACCPPSNETDKDQQIITLEPATQALQGQDAIWYTHTDGWQGATFEQALNFCMTKESRSPCPYEAYCPQGPHHSPVEGGPNGEEGLSWSPIIDEVGHGIVQVGGSTPGVEEEACKIRYFKAGDDLRSEGVLSLMTHVMCCQLLNGDEM